MELNILASKSPRRYYLLNKIGFKFSVIHSDFIEHMNNNLPPNALAETLARSKALNVAKKYSNKIIIGADTIVCINDKIFGKPNNDQDKFNMLKYLSGKRHEVITGVSLVSLNKGIDHTFNNRTIVKVKTISDEEIKIYSKNFKGFDKAGGYGIQDGFSIFIEEIQGCYYNAMGFPLSSFYKQYKKIFKSFY
tara:strand:- start:1290 stop:1865 length:576 start_codon:yes stop_codon:yes gene_type:complete